MCRIGLKEVLILSIFERYGIKEVADVYFHKINSNGSPGAPVLYLDTLKVSSIEQAAETVTPKGGMGNEELFAWDFGRSITLKITDALFSMRSLAMMYGGEDSIKEAESITITARAD